MFTYNELCQQAQASKSEYINTELPVVTFHYFDFAQQIGLDFDEMHSLQTYIRKVSYAEKRAIFEALGFKVLFMTLSIIKLGHNVQDNTNGESLEQQFLHNKRNVFIVNVESGTDTLLFLLEYPLNGDPLADHTVDHAELQRQEEQRARIRSIFKRK